MSKPTSIGIELANEALMKHQEPLNKARLPRPGFGPTVKPDKTSGLHLQAMRHHQRRGQYHKAMVADLEHQGAHDYDTASLLERHRQAIRRHDDMFQAHQAAVPEHIRNLPQLVDHSEADYQDHPHDKALKGK